MITISLIAINIIIFILMVISGSSFFEPTTEAILNWGGISAETVLHGDQWWRLLTCMFVHVGIFHLIMNLYILFDVGSCLEQVIGKARFLTIYLAAGVLGGVVSQAAHLNSYIVEVGASGAIFGITGAFFALLTTRFLPSEIRESFLIKISILIFVNIIYGLGNPNISMAAHIGGFLSGCILGYAFYPSLVFIQNKHKLQKITIFVIAVGTVLVTSSSLKSMKRSDAFQFDEMASKLKIIENTIHSFAGKVPTSTSKLLLFCDNELLPQWNKAAAIADKMNQLNLSEPKAKVRDYFVKWIDLHQKKCSLLAQGIRENTDVYINKIKSIDEEILKLSIEDKKSPAWLRPAPQKKTNTL